MTPLRLGVVTLLDAAPLYVAQALGFAVDEQLDVTLEPAPGWAELRDRLARGRVDAAQMLAPVPVAQALGLAGPARFEALSVLNANGNTVGVSQALAGRMRAAGYGFDFADARGAGAALLAAVQGRLRIGVPFPFSMHVELVRYWLDGLGQTLSCGWDITTVPPPRMAEALETGEIDAFCVGEPMGSAAVDRGAGVLLLPGSAIWAFAPEKVLATRAGWAEDQPDLAGRLIRAVWRAGCWLGIAANRTTASELLSAPDRLGVAAEVIDRALTGRMVISDDGAERTVPYMIDFAAGAATFPWRSQAAWIGARLANRHGLDPTAAIPKAKAVFRSDLHRLHLRGTGADLPGASAKLEGALDRPTPVASARGQMILPADLFFDARIFDPDAPLR